MEAAIAAHLALDVVVDQLLLLGFCGLFVFLIKTLRREPIPEALQQPSRACGRGVAVRGFGCPHCAESRFNVQTPYAGIPRAVNAIKVLREEQEAAE